MKRHADKLIPIAATVVILTIVFIAAFRVSESSKEERIDLSFNEYDISMDFGDAMQLPDNADFLEITEILKSLKINDIEIFIFKYNDGIAYYGYLKNSGELDILGKIDDYSIINSDSLSLNEYRKVLGSESGFVIGCLTNSDIYKYLYYSIDGGIVSPLTSCTNSTVEVDINKDGFSELVSTYGNPVNTYVQMVIDKNIYECNINQSVVKYLPPLVENELETLSVQYDRNYELFYYERSNNLKGTLWYDNTENCLYAKQNLLF